MMVRSRLNDVSNAAVFRELTNDNFTILAEEIAKRVATYQNGSPTTVIGPPTSGTRVLNEFWRDARTRILRGASRSLRSGTVAVVRSGNVASIRGSINQDATFDQIKEVNVLERGSQVHLTGERTL